jgi:hypothetical protein
MSVEALALGQGFAGLSSAVIQAEAQRAQTKSAILSLQEQRMFAERRAEDVIRRGQAAESQQRQQTRKLIGSQRAAMAAQGIDIQAGTAFEIQSEAEALGALDAATIRNNAARGALGLRFQAGALETQQDIERITGRARRRGTLLTGGLQFLRGARAAAGTGKVPDDPSRIRSSFQFPGG